MIDLDLFFRYFKGRCRGNRFYAKNGKLPIFVALAYKNAMGYRYVNGRVNSTIHACILCENFVKFGPVTAAVSYTHLTLPTILRV